jgi:hypothetical protein
MHLFEDEKQQVYVWVDDNDESQHISPHFDYEADAIQWYQLTVLNRIAAPQLSRIA